MELGSVSSSPPLTLGVIGLGLAGSVMVHAAALHPQIRLVGAADPQPAARDAFARQFQARVYSDASELCGDPEIEAVYVATPHHLHRPHAVMAAEHGKHALIEKPLALSLRDCDAIAEAAVRHGVQIVVGHTHGFDPAVQKIRDLAASGAFGALGLIAMWNYTNFLYRPRRPEELDTSRGGGVVFNQLPHQIDIVRMIGGDIRSVRAQLARLDPSRPTEGLAAALLLLESGAAASLVYSGYDHFDSDAYCDWIAESGAPKPSDQHGAAQRALAAHVGDEATLRRDTFTLGARPFAPAPHQPHFGAMIVTCADADLRPVPDGVMIYDRDKTRLVRLVRGEGVPGRREALDELFAAVRLGRAPLHDALWGRRTLAAALALLVSAREEREVSLASLG